MKYIQIVIAACSLAATGCSKDEQSIPAGSCNCEVLKQSIRDADANQARTEFFSLTADLLPEITPRDEWGQEDNIQRLAHRISSQCGIEATVPCYNCIETLPPQSEMILSFTEQGIPYRIAADISYTPQKMLRLVAFHQ